MSRQEEEFLLPPEKFDWVQTHNPLFLPLISEGKIQMLVRGNPSKIVLLVDGNHPWMLL